MSATIRDLGTTRAARLTAIGRSSIFLAVALLLALVAASPAWSGSYQQRGGFVVDPILDRFTSLAHPYNGPQLEPFVVVFGGNDLIAADLNDAALANATFLQINLAQVRLSFADLTGADFTDAVLDSADLDFIDAENAIFDGAFLSGANLDNAQLRFAWFSGTDMSGLQSASGADFFEAILTSADLSNANLANASFSRADFLSATLNGATLTGSTLDDASLLNADLSFANLDNASFSGADFSSATLGGASLNGSTLDSASLLNADLSFAVLNGASLLDVTFGNTVLTDTDFTGADLSNVDLSTNTLPLATRYTSATMDGAILAGVTIGSAEFDSASLASADLSMADLQDAHFQVADLSSANLENAVLQRSDFTQATLSGTNLRFADLTDAIFDLAAGSDVIFDSATLDGVSLQGANFSGLLSSFQQASLVGADLSNASTMSSNFTGADFTSARLVGGDFSSANFDDAVFANADLSGVSTDFQNANFSSADLQSADLRDADFMNATFVNAFFDGATIAGADFRSANFSNATLTPMAASGALFESASFDGAVLGGNLQNASFALVDFANATFTNADLSGANLIDADGLLQSSGVAIFDRFTDFTGTGFDPFLQGWSTLDQAPSLLVSAPLDGSSVAFGFPVQLQATSNDAEDGDLTASIQWSSSLDGALGTGGTFAPSNLTVGTHTISAVVEDTIGYVVTETAIVTIFVNLPPVTTIDTPANGFVETAGRVVTLAAQSTDPQEGDLAASVVWSSDLDGVIGTGAILPTTSLSIGQHTITATVVDEWGFIGADSVSIEIVPNALPVLTIGAPSDSSVFVIGSDVTFEASASDAEDGNLVGVITWTSDLDGALGQGSPLVVDTLTEGVHTVTATVTDTLGAQDQQAIEIEIQLEQRPIVQLTAPSADTTILLGDQAAFSATASDLQDGDLTPSIDWTSNLDGPLGTGGSIAVSSLSVGTHTITASVVDTDTNAFSTTVVVYVDPIPATALYGLEASAAGYEIFSVDPGTGAATTLWTLPSNEGREYAGLAWRPDSGFLYLTSTAVAVGTGNEILASPRLERISIATGRRDVFPALSAADLGLGEVYSARFASAVAIAPGATDVVVVALSAFPGDFAAVDPEQPMLVFLDAETGEVRSDLGDGGMRSLTGAVESMTYHPLGDRILAGRGLGSAVLTSIDPATGTATDVSPASIPTTLAGLTFDPADGRLLGAQGAFDDDLVVLDAITGVVTEVVGDFGRSGPAGIAYVPEPSTGLALLAGVGWLAALGRHGARCARRTGR